MVVEVVDVRAKCWQSTVVGTVWVVVAAVFVAFFVVIESFGTVGCVALIYLSISESVGKLRRLVERKEASALPQR